MATDESVTTLRGMALTKEDERRKITLLEVSYVSFMVIGSFCIILGALDMLVGFVALIYGSLFASIFTYVWAGFIFALVNGALVLRAVKNKPHVDAHWANVTLGFGIVSLIMQFVDTMFAFQGMVSCKTTEVLTVRSNQKDSITFYVSPVSPEAVRCVFTLLLFLLEVWQVAVSIALRRFFSRKHSAPVALHFVNSDMSRPPTYDSTLPPPYVAPPAYAENHTYTNEQS